MVTHVVLLARDLDVRVVRLVERRRAVRAVAPRPGAVAAVRVAICAYNPKVTTVSNLYKTGERRGALTGSPM